MIKIEFKRLMFNIAEIWFSDHIYDVEGYSHVKFRRCGPQEKYSGFNCEEEITSVIDLTPDLDTIWKNIKKDSTRRPIRRAEEAGVVIKRNENFDEFYEIYRTHLSRKKYHIIPYHKESLKKAGTLFTAELNGEVLGGSIFIEDQDHMLAHTGASKIIDNDKPLNTLKGQASRLIKWEAMKYAKKKGIKEFDMGGLFTDSLNSFKESFGGKRVTYYAYYKDYDTSYKLAANVGLLLYRLRNSRSSFKK